VPKLLIGEPGKKPSIDCGAPEKQLPVPEKKISTRGFGLLGKPMTTLSRLVHPIEPNSPVGTIFVVRKLVTVVKPLAVIIPGTSNDQLSLPGLLKVYMASAFASAAEAREPSTINTIKRMRMKAPLMCGSQLESLNRGVEQDLSARTLPPPFILVK